MSNSNTSSTGLDECHYKDIIGRLDATQRALAFLIKQMNRLTNESEKCKWREV